MLNDETISEEIVIVGERYGDLADVIMPLFNQVEPHKTNDIIKALGSDVVYLIPASGLVDKKAVAVYTENRKRLGYVWMCQSHAVRDWMEEKNQQLLAVRIKEINSVACVLIAETVKPVCLPKKERYSQTIDLDWACNLPMELPYLKKDSVRMSIFLMNEALEEEKQWSDLLRLRIDNLLEDMPLELSAYSNNACMELYYKMKDSPIEEVRQHAPFVLASLVERGSANHMKWWLQEWLPDQFELASETDLLAMFEAANYTLAKVEELLHTAPEHLFHLYKVNKTDFANTLYYASLPECVYNRLMTLLAVRELMLEKRNRGGRMEYAETEEGEYLDLCFLTAPCFASMEGQNQLRALLTGLLSRMDVDSGRDWVAVYIAYHFFIGQRMLMKRYADFFCDIECLLPGVLTKLDNRHSGYNRYKSYIASMALECNKWFVDKGCLPPMNLWRSNSYTYQVDDNRQDRIQALVAEVYQGLRRIKNL